MWAVTITANSTTRFYDNFEAPDAVGSAPSANVGSWSVFGAGQLAVSNAVPPGAFDGNQYLKMWRTGGGGTAAAADFGLTSSGNLKAAFSLFIPTGSPNAVAYIMLGPDANNVNTPKVLLFVKPSTDNKVYYYNSTQTSELDTGFTYQPGVWQTWQIGYTFDPVNPDPWTVSVNGNTSTSIHSPGVTDGNLQYLNFSTGAFNSEFFLDAPEPSAAVLVGLAGLALWRRKRTAE